MSSAGHLTLNVTSQYSLGTFTSYGQNFMENHEKSCPMIETSWAMDLLSAPTLSVLGTAKQKALRWERSMNYGWVAYLRGHGLLEELQWQASLKRVSFSWHVVLLQATHERGHSEPRHGTWGAGRSEDSLALSLRCWLIWSIYTQNTWDTKSGGFPHQKNSSVSL